MEDNIETKIKPPRSPLALYVMLYCKRRDKSKSKYHNVLTEATKSWLSLSKLEKVKFLKKYNDCQIEYNKKIANQLKLAKPYMKKKHILFRDKRKESVKDITTDLDLVENENKMSVMEVDNLDNDVTSMSNIGYLESSRTKDETQLMMMGHTNVEPTPPAIISGEHLFYMVHGRKENENVWATLNSTQKRNYQTAILTIKRKYLKEYQSYLENLPTQELITHYKNIVN